MSAPYVTREALAARSPALARAIAADAYRYEPRMTCAGADNATEKKDPKRRKPRQIHAATWLKRPPAGSALLRSMLGPARKVDAKRLAAETREQQERRRRAGR